MGTLHLYPKLSKNNKLCRQELTKKHSIDFTINTSYMGKLQRKKFMIYRVTASPGQIYWQYTF